MGRPSIPVEPRPCRHCGKLMERKRINGRLEDRAIYTRRLYCDRTCMAAAYMGQIKVMNERNSRRQSRRQSAASCQACGRSDKTLYVHRRDQNALNNEPSNLVTLCGSCHRRSHSPNFDPITIRRKPCAHCSRPAMKIGLCYSHLTRLRKHGDPCLTMKKIRRSFILVRDVSVLSR